MEERIFGFDTQTVIHIVAQAFNVLLLFVFAALLVLVTLALLMYLRSKEVRRETAIIRQSLGEALRAQRIRCNMTQEFVAEALGVSRQAVSKWENGTSDPSTSNLIALAKLYGVSAEELLRGIG
ncbi:MAG: helix-turn-helix domain-containing protein [Oscillospiraceae bacterium]|nr:helix-turn-helix domain-containing protein [Oscillospiraceae bacterium]